MSNGRLQTCQTVLKRNQKTQPNTSRTKISTIFGTNIFNKKAMKEHLTSEAYKKVVEAMDAGVNLDRNIAPSVASGLQAWAISKGATHFTHWFQPLTGSTAEKHDSFYKVSLDGNAIENFSGSELVQQEPDASSLPSGGIRSTFEARGYTAWDPSSPAFILGDSLCIPSIFVSYTGESLDFKTPLLKSLHALDKAATPVAQLFDKNVTKVISTLGWEQEYFLVDELLFTQRPDLLLAGRAMFGHNPAKGQQMEDHYFGSIPERAKKFMIDLEDECYLLGIPLRTRHNEVAPSQYEFAPIFEEANVAVDHNVLLMDLMGKVARRNGLRCLLHEKPFKTLNGSGKHCNWSLSTDTGSNLLSPGKTPRANLKFLTFFITTIKAVSRYADLLRSTIASAENEHRMGANEAPPAILSVFIGSTLTKTLQEIVAKVDGSRKMTPTEKTELKLEIIGKIPELFVDNTDRNRTSPFAFTGNKFEFRAVGSSQNPSSPLTVLNTAVAQQLKELKKDVDTFTEKGLKKDEAVLKVLKGYIEESQDILFEGDGYSDEWVVEAQKRGLKNVQSVPDATKFFKAKDSVELFAKNNIFTSVEIEARYEILLEKYMKTIQIESRSIGEIASNSIFPSAVKYQNILLKNVKALKEIYGNSYKEKAKVQLNLIEEISQRLEKLRNGVVGMIEERKTGNNIEDIEMRTKHYELKVKPYFSVLRKEIDKLEFIIDDENWPLPKDRELLFII